MCLYDSCVRVCVLLPAVCWLNSCLHEGPTDLTCSVIIVDPVGMRLSSAAPAKPQPDTATLAQLLHGYLGEVLHNIFCQRLFVWEQVRNTPASSAPSQSFLNSTLPPSVLSIFSLLSYLCGHYKPKQLRVVSTCTN